MREKDLVKLEFFRILELLREYVHSKATERYLQEVRPIRDSELLLKEMNLVEDFIPVSDRVNLYAFDDIE
ncbi:MAG: hypothetical protein D6699_04260, partial [Aquificota bacterium]